MSQDDIEIDIDDIQRRMDGAMTSLKTEFASLRGAITDNTSRLASLERAMALLQSEMRDLRGGVTHQLVSQDERLGGIEQKLDEVLQRLPRA